MNEWGSHYRPDPDEQVDFMVELHPGMGGIIMRQPDPRPLHEPELGLMDEEALPLLDDWMRGPCVQPCGLRELSQNIDR